MASSYGKRPGKPTVRDSVVRQWAQDKGLPVGDKGAISNIVYEKYLDAHPHHRPKPKPKK